MKISEIRNLETMYVGGGTPTALNLKQLERLFKSNTVNFFQLKVNIHFEANPDELT